MSDTVREKLVIIGSGPAAWTAAIYAARAQLDPFVIEGSFHRTMVPGGQLMFTTEVENYPGFPDGVTGQAMMDDFKKQALRFGTRSLMEDVERVDFTGTPHRLWTSDDTEYEADAVIVATGANARWLDVPGEEHEKVVYRLIDPEQYCHQHVLVVGGGDSALEAANSIAEQPGTRVTLSYRSEAFSRAKEKNRHKVEQAASEGRLNVLLKSNVTEILEGSVKLDPSFTASTFPSDRRIEAVPPRLLTISPGLIL